VGRARLIESHLPLVRAVARRYAGRGEAVDDLIQVGAIGLIEASDRFDPSRGVAFATFATPAIEGAIRRHLGDRTTSVRIPRDLQRMSGDLRRWRSQLAAELGRSPTVRELASALNADQRDVERAISAERARDSVPISAELDSLEQTGSSEPLTGSDDRMALAASVRALDDRERRIVLLRFHADMTERQIARELGISQAHVSRLLAGALAKLRAELGSSRDDAGLGDITADRVISPGTESALSRLADDQSGENLHKRPPGGTKIAGVGASEENPKLGRYLELPYHVAVRSEQEGDRSWWSATVEELPGCTARGRTPDEAADLVRPAMEAWLSAALAEKREIPMPNREAAKAKAAARHSGRFLVRMPSDLHEQLVRAAEREEVSLNRFVTDVLAASIDPGQRIQPSSSGRLAAVADESEPAGARRPARALRVALATNLAVVLLAALVAVALLVLALERGI
jgi:RNA polymerase sigma-B factor